MNSLCIPVERQNLPKKGVTSFGTVATHQMCVLFDALFSRLYAGTLRNSVDSKISPVSSYQENAVSPSVCITCCLHQITRFTGKHCGLQFNLITLPLTTESMFRLEFLYSRDSLIPIIMRNVYKRIYLKFQIGNSARVFSRSVKCTLQKDCIIRNLSFPCEYCAMLSN